MSRRATIADFKHRIRLCTMSDVVINETEISLNREMRTHCWAKIEESRGSAFASGVVVGESREKESHKITVRYNADLLVSVYAWVYEERRKSPPRWYKVLSVRDVGENGEFTEFSCRLVEKNDLAPKPSNVIGDAVSLPQGVRL